MQQEVLAVVLEVVLEVVLAVVLLEYKPTQTRRSVFGQLVVEPCVALVAAPMATLTSALILDGPVLAGPSAVPRFLVTIPLVASVGLPAPLAVQAEEQRLAHIAPSAAEVVPEAAAEA